MEKDQIVIVEFTTDSKKEAKKIVTVLLEKKLIACANIIRCESMYWWKNKIDTANEYMTSAKTIHSKIEQIEKTISMHHSYEMPVCILKKCSVNKAVYRWIKSVL